MATKREIDARTKIRKARDDQAYNDKIAAMLAADTKEEKAKKESRKKTDDALKYALTNNILGKISSLLNIKALNKFKKKLDPRLYNGAILLGLDSPVIKSHGNTDYIGFKNSLSVCEKIIRGKLIEKIKNNIL